MDTMPTDISTRAGTAGGTLLVVVLNIQPEEMVKTILLAALGATVSFGVSLILKLLIRYLRRK